MDQKLDKYEKEIEENISSYEAVTESKKALIEEIIDKADAEGLPYQTLLSSIVHKFVSDQLVDKRSILKSIEILKAT